MKSFDKQNLVPLYRQVYNYYRLLIEDGTYKLHDQIPSERQISEELSISRMTVRKAMEELVGDGFLTRVTGKGTFVRQTMIRFEPSTLFSFSTSLKLLGYEIKTKIISVEVEEPSIAVRQPLNISKAEKVICIRRLRYVNSEPVSIDITYLPFNEYEKIITCDLTIEPLHLTMEKVSGCQLKFTSDFIEGVSADKFLSQTLNIPIGSSLLLITGVSFSSFYKPLRYVLAYYRSDRFRFSVGKEIFINRGEE